MERRKVKKWSARERQREDKERTRTQRVRNTINRSSASKLANGSHRYRWLYIIVFKSCGHSLQSALNQYCSFLFVGILHIVQCCLRYCLINSPRWAEAPEMAVERAQVWSTCEKRECISSPAVPSPSQRWKVNRASSHKPRSLYTSVPLLFQQHHNALWQLPSWRINMDSLQIPPALCHSWVFKHWSSR